VGIYEQLTPIFRDVFDNDDIEVTPDLTADKVEGWDSLGQVRLIIAIERALKITLSTTEIAGLENVGQLAQVVEAKLKAI
jgi:acyl carrier protein